MTRTPRGTTTTNTKKLTRKQAIAKFDQACALLREIAEGSRFRVYLANDMFNLMDGPTHDHRYDRGNPLHENVIAQHTVPGSSGGDW